MKKQYKVTDKSDLSYLTDAKIIKRILSGEDVPDSERLHKEAHPGDIVCDIPDVSIDALLEQGFIEECNPAQLLQDQSEKEEHDVTESK